MNLYFNKDNQYFSKARTEIEPFLPKATGSPFSALEIGCSEGHTLEWLKRTGYCSWTAGVEPYAKVDVPQRDIDYFSNLDIEKHLPEIAVNSVDLILCLDVLEHLVNPWLTVTQLIRFLKPNGRLIISLPNVRNYHILLNLAFRGKFEYAESGILDQTHLRFFTKSSAISLLESSGLKVICSKATEADRWQKRFLKLLGFEELTAKQFLFVAERS
jgi:SAM-dependent methyltransferase